MGWKKMIVRVIVYSVIFAVAAAVLKKLFVLDEMETRILSTTVIICVAFLIVRK